MPLTIRTTTRPGHDENRGPEFIIYVSNSEFMHPPPLTFSEIVSNEFKIMSTIVMGNPGVR